LKLEVNLLIVTVWGRLIACAGDAKSLKTTKLGFFTEHGFRISGVMYYYLEKIAVLMLTVSPAGILDLG